MAARYADEGNGGENLGIGSNQNLHFRKLGQQSQWQTELPKTGRKALEGARAVLILGSGFGNEFLWEQGKSRVI